MQIFTIGKGFFPNGGKGRGQGNGFQSGAFVKSIIINFNSPRRNGNPFDIALQKGVRSHGGYPHGEFQIGDFLFFQIQIFGQLQGVAVLNVELNFTPGGKVGNYNLLQGSAPIKGAIIHLGNGGGNDNGGDGRAPLKGVFGNGGYLFAVVGCGNFHFPLGTRETFGHQITLFIFAQSKGEHLRLGTRHRKAGKGRQKN